MVKDLIKRKKKEEHFFTNVSRGWQRGSRAAVLVGLLHHICDTYWLPIYISVNSLTFTEYGRFISSLGDILVLT